MPIEYCGEVCGPAPVVPGGEPRSPEKKKSARRGAGTRRGGSGKKVSSSRKEGNTRSLPGTKHGWPSMSEPSGQPVYGSVATSQRSSLYVVVHRLCALIVLPQCEMSSDGRSGAGAKHAPSSYPNAQIWSAPPEAFQYGRLVRTCSYARR